MRWLFAVIVVIALLGAERVGEDNGRAVVAWESRAAERHVAAMPGVGDGWIDTLRRIAGPARIDTLTPEIVLPYTRQDRILVGQYEHWYDLVRIAPAMPAYYEFLEAVCSIQTDFAYRHPSFLASPAGVLAHEMGHMFQHRIVGALHGWDRVDAEQFADRFALAALSIRGWIALDSSDVMLEHVMRRRLAESYLEAP